MAIITLADLKSHMNITTTDDDAVLTSKIDAASEWVAKYTGSRFIDPDDQDQPAPVKEAVRQLAGHLYENREATLVGISAEMLPFGVRELLAPYREWSF